MKKATSVLHVTVPTISDQIKKLEHELGIKLFERKARSLVLTRDGKALYEKVYEIFSTGKKLLDSLNEESVGGYEVKVGVENPILSIVQIDFLMSYWDIYAPYGTVSTEKFHLSSDLKRELLSGTLDWTISFEPLLNENLETAKIGSANIVFCCSRALFDKIKNKNVLLVEIPLGRFKNAVYFNNLILDRLSEMSINPHEIIDSDEESFLFELLEKGRAILAISERLAKAINTKGKLVYFTPGSIKIPIPVFTGYAKSRKNLLAIKNLHRVLSSKNVSSLQKGPLWQYEVANPVAVEKT